MTGIQRRLIARHIYAQTTHAVIACGGEITKAAKNWLGTRLDATKCSRVMFMDRDDILNLSVVTTTPPPESDGQIPF